MKPLVLSCLVGVSTLGSLSAANIAWVSFHSGDDTPSGGAAGAGFTEAPDVGYTDLLASNGHTVTRVVSSSTPDTVALSAFDLVIISRSVASGNFQTAPAPAAWNGITAPMIVMSGYLTRNSRLGFTTGGTVPDTFNPGDATVNSISLTAVNPAHPIFNGITLDGSNLMVNPFATEVTANATIQRGISVNTDALGAGGTLIATIGTPGDAATGGTIIAEWSAGATMTNGTADTLGGDRLVFFSGTREADGISGETAGILDLNADGQQMFLNAVDYMAVPEPSSMALAGLGLLGLLRRRRA